MPTSKEAAAAVAATAANDAIQGQAALAAQQAILARQAQAQAAQRAEFTYLAGVPANRRTVAQNNRLAVFLATVPMTQQAGPTALHALSTSVAVLEMHRGSTIYRLSDPSDGFYVVVDGRVVLYDVKDREEADSDDGMVERLSRSDCFGEEDLLSNSRRAHRADVSHDAGAILLRVSPEMYRKYLQHLHQPDFEDKVNFLSQLEVFRTLPDETLRKLAPCFSQMELRAKEYLVRQGERADSMFAIASGQCSVLVDPNFRSDSNGLAESDPKKAMQVCLIGPGNIVGDMTVLANVRKRTASILCLTDLITYKIRRATFIRRVPGVQLEALRQVAEAKLRITERRLHSAQAGPGSGGGPGGPHVMLSVRDKILHGYDLRQLSQPASAAIPVDLRNITSRRSLSGAAENLLAGSLALMAAAGASGGDGGGGAGAGYTTTTLTPSMSYGGVGIGTAGPLSAAAAASVASMSSAAAVSYGGWTGVGVGAAVGDARMRFSGPRRNSSLHVPCSGAGGMSGGAGGGVPGPGGERGGALSAATVAGTAKSRSRTGAAMAALMGGSRGQDINFTWGLGPGTLINTLLERPATANSLRRSAPASAAAGGAASSGDPAVAAAVAAASAASAADPFSGGPSMLTQPVAGGGMASALQSRPQAAHHLSFNYSRPGGGQFPGGGGGGNGAFTGSRPSGTTFGQIRDSVSVPLPPSYSSIPSADFGLSFSIVGVGVAAPQGPPPLPAPPASAASLRRNSSRSARLANASAGPEVTSSRASISGISLRNGLNPSGPQSPTLGAGEQGQEQEQEHQEGAPPTSDAASPATGDGSADGPSTTAATAERGASPPSRKSTRRVGLSVDTVRGDDTSGGGGAGATPGSRGSMAGSLWGGMGDASQQPDQGSDGEGLGSPVSMGSLSPTRSRSFVRRQKSMGKARFSPKLVTQNSSVDALVAEVMVSALAKDVLLQQARAMEAAMVAEEEAMRGAGMMDGPEGMERGQSGQQTVENEPGARGLGPGEPSGGVAGSGSGSEANEGGQGIRRGHRQGMEEEDYDAKATPETSEGDLTPRPGPGPDEGQEDEEVQAREEGGMDEGAADPGVAPGGEESDGPGGDGAGEAAGGDMDERHSSSARQEGSQRRLASGPGSMAEGREPEAAETPGEDGDTGSAAAGGALVAEGSWSRRPGSAASARRISEPGRGRSGSDRSGVGSPAPEPSDDASVVSRDVRTSSGGAAGPTAAAADGSGGLRPTSASSLPRQSSHLSQPSVSYSHQLLPSVSRSAVPDPHVALLGSLSGELSRPGSASAAASKLRRLSSASIGDPAAATALGVGSAPVSADRSFRESASGAIPGGGSSGPGTAGSTAGGAGSGGGSRTAPGGMGSAGLVAMPPALPRPVSRQPATFQLVLPEAAGVGASRHGGMGVSPPRRSLPSPMAPRPYPYVGPFLSVNKGVHLPPGFSPHATTLPKPPPSAAGLGLGVGLRGNTPAERAERASPSESRSGPSSVADLAVPGAGIAAERAAVVATPPLHGTRGQLRKGGALYRPAALPRPGMPPPPQF